MSLTSFINYLQLEKNYSKHTVEAYKKDIEEFYAFAKIKYEQATLTDVHYTQIRSWIVQLVGKGITNRTVNRKISSLKSYYNFLLKIEEIVVSPLAKHKSLKVPKRSQIPFSEVEVAVVLDELREAHDFISLRDLLVVELLYGTGMRRAELVNLTLGSVDLSQKMLKVLGKRDKERLTPLLPSIVSTLRKYLQERAKIASTEQDSPLIVTNKGVKVYSMLVYRVINHYFSKASNKLKTSPHIVRHSFATHLLNQGADLNVVKELLGHASLASTQVYTHNSIHELRNVYAKTHPRSKK